MIKKVLALLICCTGIVTMASCQSTENSQASESNASDNLSENTTQANPHIGTFSAEEFEDAESSVKNMVLGWNVGNSLDGYTEGIVDGEPEDYETSWGNKVTSPLLIQAIKAQGFNAVRIPVTWLQNTDENNKINEKWLERVKEVVDYVILEDMYCIINVHHDSGGGEEAWLRADPANYDEISARFADLWTQIAEYFADYDEHLLFEGFNEILDVDSNWNGSTAENYAVVNDLNQLFVDTVRATGGNNSYRNIICNTYGASSADSQVSGFVVPKDTVKNHLISEVHIYDPSDFCTGKRSEWTEEDQNVLDTIFARLDEKIIKAQGTPVIVGEFGAQNGGNDQARAEYAAYFVSKAKEYGITAFWWDDGNIMSMKLIDRGDFSISAPEICEAMVQAARE